MNLLPTASQTVGPYFILGLEQLCRADLAATANPIERLVIRGQVTDGQGIPVPDAILEVWQADSEGRYSHSKFSDRTVGQDGFCGFGRIPTDADGHFRFITVKPGPVPGPGMTMQAPHIVVLIFMRGLLKHLMSRIYFPAEGANEEDPILALVPKERRSTLIARVASTSELRWDVRLQGEGETVFFDY